MVLVLEIGFHYPALAVLELTVSDQAGVKLADLPASTSQEKTSKERAPPKAGTVIFTCLVELDD